MNLHIKSALKSYKNKNAVRMHFPGHKGRGLNFVKAGNDITELSFSGCLGEENGIIKNAENDVAKILGVKESYFLTDGATSGILTIMHLLKNYGSKVIISRGSHRSVYNACELLNIEPILVGNSFNGRYFLPPTIEEVENAIKENSNIAGVFLTSIDYYGNVIDFKNIYNLAKKHNLLVCYDNAHGSHLRFTNSNNYVGAYADIYVDSLHKTMPTLTQGALLNVNNLNVVQNVKKALLTFRTTSPSYLIMASIEYGVKKVESIKTKLLGKENVLKFVNVISSLGYIVSCGADFYKVIINLTNLQVSPSEFVNVLEKNKIFIELFDGKNIILSLSPFTTKADLLRVIKVLKSNIKLINKKQTLPFIKTTECLNKRGIGYLDANNCESEFVLIEESANKISLENVGVLPPCYPIIVKGEVISQSSIKLLVGNKNTFGIENGKIKVLK